MGPPCLIPIMDPELCFPQKQYSLSSSGSMMFAIAKTFAGEESLASILRACGWEVLRVGGGDGGDRGALAAV